MGFQTSTVNGVTFLFGTEIQTEESNVFSSYFNEFKDGTIKLVEELTGRNTGKLVSFKGVDGKTYNVVDTSNPQTRLAVPILFEDGHVYDIIPEEVRYTTYYPRIAKECANAYREKTGETELVKAQELPKLIENMKAAELPNGKVWKQSNITSGNFTAVAYGKGIYVATGANGIYWSEDGKTWTQSNITDNLSCDDLIYANGVFVAAGITTRYSIDGKTWAESSGTSTRLLCVIYGKDLFIAGSDSHGLFFSTDGKIWNESNKTTSPITCLAYGNGIFIAGNSRREPAADTLLYSTDGKTWTKSDVAFTEVLDILYANGIFVAACGSQGFYWSNDGKNWTVGKGFFSGTGLAEKLAYGNGIFIASGTQYPLHYSFDGKTWIANQSINALLYCHCLFYANGVYISNLKPRGLYYSTNGIDWTQSNITTGNFNKIFHANDKFIAAGDNGLYYSETSLPNAPIGVKLINFIVNHPDGRFFSFNAVDDMTWKEFIESQYNIDNQFSNINDKVYFDGSYLIDNTTNLELNINNKIIDKGEYTIRYK